MKSKTPVIPFDASVTDAISYLKKDGEGFAIVQASSDRFQGVLTEAILVRIFLRYQAHPENEALVLYRDLLEPAQLTHENEFLPEIVKKVVTSVGNRVFVIDDRGHVKGYITAKDILPYFTPEEKKQRAKKTPVDQEVENLSSDLYLFETFFAKSPFMMHSVDREGKIQMANEMLHVVLGYSFGELVGKTIFDLYPKDVHAKAEASLKSILESGYHKVVQSHMVHKNKKKILVEVVSKALTNQFQDRIGTMTVSRPVDMKYMLECLPEL
jgi:PAS domain S-box-containing protein